MARYDAYANPRGPGYLLDVQADILEDLSTRVVVPLVPRTDALATIRQLNPIIMIDGKAYALYTHLIAERGMNLRESHDRAAEALEMLFQGF